MEDPQARLDAARAQTRRRLTALSEDYAEVVAASRDTNADDEHDPEGATIAFERSQTAALLAATRGRLAELDAAQDRLARGVYGDCESCAGPIGGDRLVARPETRLCIGGASAI